MLKHEKHEKDLEVFSLFRGHFRSLEVVVKAHRSALVKA